MGHGARGEADFVPRLPDLIVTMGGCWRVVCDVQAEVDPAGGPYAALDGLRTAIEALAHQLTGQRGFFVLAEPAARLPAPGDAPAEA